MNLLLKNALLLDLDLGGEGSPPKPGLEAGDLRIRDGKIKERGSLEKEPGETVHDCGGAVVLPGLVNGHTHLYSALAAGMPAPPRTPRNFHDILKLVWWRLDRAHDEASNTASALAGAMDALHCGTTTFIDHHASPECIDGSLDMIEAGLAKVGVRGLLCYEVTDRNGRDGRVAGLAESERYLGKCAKSSGGKYGALIGGHASFTLDEESMAALADLAVRHKSAVHLHVAEDPCDEVLTLSKYDVPLVDRLERHGLLGERLLLAHGTHLNASDIQRANAAKGLRSAHNTRSNMNNAVGYAPIGKLKIPVQLGTDGIGADMFEEARTAWFKSCDGGAGISPDDVLAMLANAARTASKFLGVTLGRLAVGAEADIVVTKYIPSTPLHEGNVAGHFLFALAARHVTDVMVAGEWRLRDGALTSVDEVRERQEIAKVSKALWQRLEGIKP
ncbi:MAG: amidohydrolase family protein [Candidatus Sumerlaeia bacterium]|nr:amidohydrolase family protein [Candidatus Sumerlaeia bacterium]